MVSSLNSLNLKTIEHYIYTLILILIFIFLAQHFLLHSLALYFILALTFLLARFAVLNPS